MSEIAEIERNHGRLLTLDRKGCHKSFSDAVDYLLGGLEDAEPSRIRKRRQQDRANLRATLEAVLADLYAANVIDPTLALGYSRNGNDYNQPKRYRSAAGSLLSMVTVADFLTKAGYAEHKDGYYRRASNPADGWLNGGERSRLRATPKLIGVLQDAFGVRPEHIERQYLVGELIRLRDAEARLIDYTDNATTIQMRDQLTALNKALVSAKVELSKPCADITTDLTNKSIYRVFNDGRFDRGGRFYGGWWISAKREYRQNILIDGEPTVELDYSAFHARLCYHLMGKEAPLGDLYAIEGLEDAREAVKWAFNVLLNLKAGQRMPSPNDKIKGLLSGKWTVTKLRKAVVEHFKEIEGWLGAGKGTELQYIDSQIASKVLGSLLEQGIVCLPVHDSFIISKKHERLLLEAMTTAYTEVLLRYKGSLSAPTPAISNK